MTWENISTSMLAQLDAAIADSLAPSDLIRKREAIATAIDAYREHYPLVPPLTLSREDATGMTIRAVLRLLATRNNNVMPVRDATSVMVDAGIISGPNTDAIVYSVLAKAPEFTRLAPGVYLLSPSPR